MSNDSSSYKTTEHEDMILSAITDEIILDLCFEMHYAVKCGDMTLDDLYGVDPIESYSDSAVEAPKDNRKNYSSSQSNIVTCPVCYETVAGQRFAPHLEKCLNGGKRGGLPSKKASGAGCSTNNMGIGLPYYSQIKKVDPYPLSLIVRIRLKDGLPRKNQVREGGLLSDFLSWKEIESAVAASKETSNTNMNLSDNTMDLT